MTQRTFAIFGDSISTFEGFVPEENAVYYQGELLDATGVRAVDQTWWMRVINRFGGRLLANGSFSGSMVEGAGFPAACSWQRISQIAGSQGESPDVILVFSGINDYGWGGAAAQAAGRSAAMPPCMDNASMPEGVAGAASPGVLAGFEQAYRGMLTAIRARYPQAETWCLTLVPGRERGAERSTFCYKLRGIDLDAYNDAIRKTAHECGCRVADIYQCGCDYEATDGTHPTARGMEQVAAMACAAIARVADEGSVLHEGAGARVGLDELRDEAGERLFLAAMASMRLCEEALCVGCEFARNTGNQWSCVCERFSAQSDLAK